MSAKYSMKGVQDLIEVFEDKITIKPKGVLGFMNKGLKGTKEIPFYSISAIQFKEAGTFVNGYLQFTIPGGNESKRGVFSATQDENTFMFAKKDNAMAKQIKSYIESEIKKARNPQANSKPNNVAEELQKLVDLKLQGILSEDEFRLAKVKLLS